MDPISLTTEMSS